jgi:hypothetical protein
LHSGTETIMSKQSFKVGERVKLLPFEEQPEETGKVLESEGMGLYIVQIDTQFRDVGDDGLREVNEDQLQKE